MEENKNLTEELPGPGSNTGREIDLVEIFHLLKSKILFVIAAAVLFACVAGIYSQYFIPRQYRAKARIYVDADYTEAEATLAISLATNIAKDYPYIIESHSVMEEVSNRMGLGVSGASLLNCVEVKIPDEDVLRVLDIYVTYTSAQGAANMANTVVEVFKEKVPEYAKYSKIEIGIIDPAEVPSGPISPNVTGNAVIAGFLGAVLMAGVFIIINLLDDKIKSEDDIERYLGLNMLAAIPDYAELQNQNVTGIKKLLKSTTGQNSAKQVFENEITLSKQTTSKSTKKTGRNSDK